MNSVVIFVHIPKCGGMTFNEVLRSIYGPRLFYHAEIGDKLAITMAADLREFEAVTSHARYGLHERFGRPGVYLSIIREPLENFVSFYNDVTNKPGHFLYPDTKEMEIEQFFAFLDARDHPVLRNRQCLHICNSADYLLAREYVETRYALVAPLECFDEFVRQFCQLINKPVPRFEAINISTKKVHADALSFAFKQRVYNRNSSDLRLYHLVRERFLLA